jgi:hypothetical protein
LITGGEDFLSRRFDEDPMVRQWRGTISLVPVDRQEM